MGTRSLTVIHDGPKDNVILCLYRQMDGYPSGMGMDLKNFLEGAKLVNGYSMDDANDKRTFNGMGDLAVRLLTYLKNKQAAEMRHYTRTQGEEEHPHPATGEDCIGSYHIQSYDPKDYGWAEYIYHISPTKNLDESSFKESTTVKLTCFDVYKKKNVPISEKEEEENE